MFLQSSMGQIIESCTTCLGCRECHMMQNRNIDWSRILPDTESPELDVLVSWISKCPHVCWQTFPKVWLFPSKRPVLFVGQFEQRRLGGHDNRIRWVLFAWRPKPGPQAGIYTIFFLHNKNVFCLHKKIVFSCARRKFVLVQEGDVLLSQEGYIFRSQEEHSLIQ